MMMMIIAPNSLARQKKKVQREEEEARNLRKGGQTITTAPGADTLTGPSRLEISNARNRRKLGRCCGIPLHGKGRGG